VDSQNGRLRIGYIGQIAPHKGVHVLLMAVRQLENADGRWELRIYGDTTRFPRYAEHLRRIAGEHPRIRFEGQVENRHIPAILANLDVLVVPSLWYENAPLTILEAHAAGVPVVASDLGGMAELVRHEEDGLRFRPGDDRDLARQIRRLLDEPDLVARLRQGIGRARLVSDEVAELLTVYQQILGGR
jgi:glycosyltransferase involved in cell wall biosynthesis